MKKYDFTKESSILIQGAMDTETERNIQNSLSELKAGRTTIAIAHRLSTLRDADKLAVIDDGECIEFGT